MDKSLTPSFQHFHKNVERYLKSEASELGHESDVNEYVAMIVRVEKRMRA